MEGSGEGVQARREQARGAAGKGGNGQGRQGLSREQQVGQAQGPSINQHALFHLGLHMA